MRRALSLGLIGFLLSACEQESPESNPRTYSFNPDRPAPAPSSTVAVVKPTPSPSPRGWIEIQADRWQRATVRPEKAHFVAAIASQINRNRTRYEGVSRATSVPWQVIGAIHSMEGSLDFRTNLGQGDPLTAQSRHIPRNRPPIPPDPPFVWEYAAEDAIRYDGLSREEWRPLAQELQNLEAWNGLGYQNFHPSVPSPYLWSWSTISKPGKYIADGQWSSTAISQQCGAAVILKSLP